MNGVRQWGPLERARNPLTGLGWTMDPSVNPIRQHAQGTVPTTGAAPSLLDPFREVTAGLVEESTEDVPGPGVL